ncbi:flavodoxin family protein [Desertimonas flava]|uniref:flavodoxin family protein n=1 Tax=Desertimonas flava TaxID=2064846 RepID=UPI000E34E292|nr:flavodoxin family protein [Desertimonas flava]
MTKAALVIESLTGNTWRAAELVADGLSQYGWSITGLSKVKQPDLASIQDADLVVVGTWVHGLFVVGQTPWAVSNISSLPTMRNKRSAVFCTFGLNPGRSLDKLTGAVEATGANVLGGLALNRFKLEEHSEILTTRLVDAFDAATV